MPPADDDCCGGGACAPCVWDQYYDDLDQWHIQQANTLEATKNNQVKQKNAELNN